MRSLTLSGRREVAVYYLHGDEYCHAPPLDEPTTEAEDVATLPLAIKPGRVVAWHGSIYKLDNEGRYCFVGPDGMRNVLVFEKDFVAFFGALAQIHVNGEDHVPLSMEERLRIAQRGRLFVMCGGITSVTLELLESLGHRARRVITLHVEKASNHVLFEYYVTELARWILVDIHNHWLLECDGELGGLRELLAAAQRGRPIEGRCLSKLGGLSYFPWERKETGVTPAPSEKFAHDDEIDLNSFATPDRAWGIWTDENRCYFPEDRPELIEQILKIRENYRCLPPDEWYARFYGE